VLFVARVSPFIRAGRSRSFQKETLQEGHELMKVSQKHDPLTQFLT
jgi:hypothetical protein